MTSRSSKIGEPVRRRRKDARPAEIIEAGLTEFGLHGFEAARMEDVAQRAGIAKGTVFRYFATKEALFEAALLSRVGPLFDGLSLAVGAHDRPTSELVRVILDGFYAQIAQPELTTLMRIIIGEGTRFPAILETYHRLTIARAQEVLGSFAARAVAQGELRPGAVADLPMVIIAPGLMAAIWRMTFEGIQPIPLERFKAAHLEMIDALFRKPAAPDAARPGSSSPSVRHDA